jgi:hypothetical protein
MLLHCLRRLQQRYSSFLRGGSRHPHNGRFNPRMEQLETRLTPADVGVNDFRISDMGIDGNTSYNATDAAVAYNSTNHEYLVVWSADDVGAMADNEFEIFGQRFDAATGTPINAEFRISTMGPNGDDAYDARNPAVAYNSVNNEYLVVWEGDDNNGGMIDEEFEIFGQRLNAATGVQVGTNDFRISGMGPNGDASYDAVDPAVVYNSTDNEYLVVWRGDDNTGALVDGEFEIYGQRLNAATGAAVGINDFRISDVGADGDTAFGAFAPAVAHNSTDNQYLVVWYGDDDVGTQVDGEFEIHGQRLDAAGAEVGGNDFRISTMGPNSDTSYDAFTPAVAYNSVDNQYLVVWSGEEDVGGLVEGEFEIFGQRINAATGAQVGTNDFRISDMGADGDTSFGTLDPAVAYNSATNEYLVVWAGDDNTGGLVANEFEIFGQRINAATGGQVGANDFRLSDMGPDGDTNFNASTPALAYNAGNNEYLVVWSGDDNTGSLVDNEFEIFGQRFSPVDAVPTPPPAPQPPPSVFGVQVRRKGRARVLVFDAFTGSFRGMLAPFPNHRGRLRLESRDVNGDGAADLIVRAVINGKRRHRIYDAVTLGLLPPVLA